MTQSPASEPDPGFAPGTRIASVDALRGLVITLMIFVNDLGISPSTPSWLRHIGDTDAMTLPDIVFPAFLFIVGVSVALAFSRALAEGQTRGQLLWKALGRTFVLLVMGVVLVNMEHHEPWPRGLWGFLAYIAIFLALGMIPLSPRWQGALPYSLLVEPDGKIVYAHQGAIDPEELRKIIFDDPYMGRIFK